MPDTVLTYKGRPIVDLTKNELVDAMTWSFQEIEYQRERADRLLNAAALAEPEPEPADGEVAELVAWLRSLEDASVWFESGSPEALKLTRAADLLEQRQGGAEESSVAAPVPVSERLPGPKDCVVISWSEPRSPHVWAGKRRLINGPTEIWDWTFASIPTLEESGEFTHWLPAIASVLPAGAIRQSNPSA